MSLSSSSSSCANKREVLNRVKTILEKYVQSSVIEREDIRDLAKKSTEAVTSPAAVEEVNRATLQQLIAFLQECNADEKVITSIRLDLEAQTTAIAVEAKNGEERGEQQGRSAAAVSVFSFTSFQERMAKKKEELRRHREGTLSTAEAVSTADAPAPTTTANMATTAVATIGTGTTSSASADEDEPKVRRYKTERGAPVPVLLPLLHDEADLYSGLVADSNTRGRGGWGR